MDHEPLAGHTIRLSAWYTSMCRTAPSSCLRRTAAPEGWRIRQGLPLKPVGGREQGFMIPRVALSSCPVCLNWVKGLHGSFGQLVHHLLKPAVLAARLSSLLTRVGRYKERPYLSLSSMSVTQRYYGGLPYAVAYRDSKTTALISQRHRQMGGKMRLSSCALFSHAVFFRRGIID